jgi:hypothetical protein
MQYTSEYNWWLANYQENYQAAGRSGMSHEAAAEHAADVAGPEPQKYAKRLVAIGNSNGVTAVDPEWLDYQRTISDFEAGTGRL